MASLTELRKALAVPLETIDGLNVYPTPKGNINPDAALILPGRIDFDSTMARGTDDFIFQILLLVSIGADLSQAQDQLDQYCAGSGAKSIKDVVDTDKTLGGNVFTVRVASMDSYGDEEWGGVTYLGARFSVQVNANGE